jgi:hypothetical protein
MVSLLSNRLKQAREHTTNHLSTIIPGTLPALSPIASLCHPPLVYKSLQSLSSDTNPELDYPLDHVALIVHDISYVRPKKEGFGI